MFTFGRRETAGETNGGYAALDHEWAEFNLPKELIRHASTSGPREAASAFRRKETVTIQEYLAES